MQNKEKKFTSEEEKKQWKKQNIGGVNKENIE